MIFNDWYSSWQNCSHVTYTGEKTIQYRTECYQVSLQIASRVNGRRFFRIADQTFRGVKLSKEKYFAIYHCSAECTLISHFLTSQSNG